MGVDGTAAADWVRDRGGRAPMRERYRLSGEFHYFRVERSAWRAVLERAVGAGLDSVSIYVPWNWHQPADATPDLTGTTAAERDLRGALDLIADMGLACILRPGPFITAEWRNGGIPDWLLESAPEIVARDAADRYVLSAYPAVTYGHPRYREACRRWFESVAEVAVDFLSGRGGPIVGLQLDDETSYAQRIAQPFAVDYNPWLLHSSPERTAPYTAWLIDKYGDRSALETAHGVRYTGFGDVQPPREAPTRTRQLSQHLDWLYFKLDQINDHIGFLARTADDVGLQAPLSMLHPYLLPINAARFARYVRENELPIELTNECYYALFGPAASSELKIGQVIACHESYHMWRRGTPGPAFSMELQASNTSYVSPGAMSMLYALTIARGIKGINYYMFVGGQNPPGFENITGAEYDIQAPVRPDGSTRPHYDVIAKLSEVFHASESAIDRADPVRDMWIGAYGPYEAAALCAPNLIDSDTVTQTFNAGDIGQSDSASLAVLAALANVSAGWLDLEDESSQLADRPQQVWAPGLAFMAQPAQQRLADYVAAGGHLVLLPGVPYVDERGRPATVLRDLIWPGGAPAEAERPDGDATDGGPNPHSIIYTADGETLVAPGPVVDLPLPTGGEALARSARSGQPCAVSCARGAGRVTVLGFRLQYMPTSGSGQFRFLRRMVETAGPIAVRTSATQVVASVLTGPEGGLLCVANSAEIPASATVHVHHGDRPEGRIPIALDGIPFAGYGALLLPLDRDLGQRIVLRHATWELVGHAAADGAIVARFAAASELGELVYAGAVAEVEVEGAEVVEKRELLSGASLLILRATRPRPEVVFSSASAT